MSATVDAATPLASTSSLPLTSPLRSSTYPRKQSVDGSALRDRQARKRTERYEEEVESARRLVETARGGEDAEGMREALEKLLSVVDGMTDQLWRDDELAAQLKIAQSNLTLAETHSEALEDAIRRRDSATAALQVSRYASGRPKAVTSESEPMIAKGGATERPGSAMGLFGLGLDSGEEERKGGFFGLIPGKKRAILGVETSARSASPYRESEREWREGENTSTTVSELTEEVQELRITIAKLKNDQLKLEVSRSALEDKVKELTGKNNDLMDEFENLSVELFSEANVLVADERKARSKAEEEVEGLQAQLDAALLELDECRNGGGDGDEDALEGLQLAEDELEKMLGIQRSLTTSASTTTLNGRTYHSTTSSLIPSTATLEPLEPLAVPGRQPDSLQVVSPSEESQPAGVKSWFNFGRPSPGTGLMPSGGRSIDDAALGSSTPLARSGSLSLEVPTSSHSMSRGDSSTSTNTTDSRSSATSSVFSTASTSGPFPEELDDLPDTSVATTLSRQGSLRDPTPKSSNYVLPLGSNFSTSPFNMLSTFPLTNSDDFPPEAAYATASDDEPPPEYFPLPPSPSPSLTSFAGLLDDVPIIYATPPLQSSSTFESNAWDDLDATPGKTIPSSGSSSPYPSASRSQSYEHGAGEAGGSRRGSGQDVLGGRGVPRRGSAAKAALKSLEEDLLSPKSPNMARWKEKSSGLVSPGGSRRPSSDAGTGRREEVPPLPSAAAMMGKMAGTGSRSLLSPRTQALVKKLAQKEGGGAGGGAGRPVKLRLDTSTPARSPSSSSNRTPASYPLPPSAIERGPLSPKQPLSAVSTTSSDLDALMRNIESMSGDVFGDSVDGDGKRRMGLGIDT